MLEWEKGFAMYKGHIMLIFWEFDAKNIDIVESPLEKS